jgi:hypothetical protein
MTARVLRITSARAAADRRRDRAGPTARCMYRQRREGRARPGGAGGGPALGGTQQGHTIDAARDGCSRGARRAAGEISRRHGTAGTAAAAAAGLLGDSRELGTRCRRG